jgi:hypothetical protein
MKYLLLVSLLAALGLGPLFAERPPEAQELEQTLAARMNDGPHGAVTRNVACREAQKRSYACVLTSRAGTEIEVQVRELDGEWTATWLPLSG